jgi:hypothetical protein
MKWLIMPTAYGEDQNDGYRKACTGSIKAAYQQSPPKDEEWKIGYEDDIPMSTI